MTKQSLASAQAALSHAATSRYQAGAGSLTLATYVLADSPEELLSRTDLTQQILLARETEMAGALEASSRARDAEHDAEIQHQQAEKALAAARAALRDAEMQASRFRHSTNHVSNPPSSGGGPPANASTGTLSPPVAGRITSPYGMRTHPLTGVYKLHSGTDYGSPCGTPVRSSDGGEVVQSGWRGAYGQSVTIAHDRGITTTYNHLSRISVSRGSPVEQGQTVGSVGTTGSSTGCHLHWEVLVDGSFTDPVGWL